MLDVTNVSHFILWLVGVEPILIKKIVEYFKALK